MTNKQKFIKVAELAALWEDYISSGEKGEFLVKYQNLYRSLPRCVKYRYLRTYDAVRCENSYTVWSYPETASILMSEAYA